MGNMSNQKTSKLPRGCLIAVDIAMVLCGGAFVTSVFGSIFTPANANVITSTDSHTAQAMNLEAQAAYSPTAEPSLTAFPTATDTQVPVLLLTKTVLPLPTVAARVVIPVTGESCIPNNPPQTGRVLDIVDGDTIVVVLDQDGVAYSVRYIGMDTPENTSQIEPFGPEATAKNRELVHGKTVTLIKDVSETDRYGRLLRYVIADGIFVNYELVAQGYANTASYPPDVACIPTFQAAEEQASAWNLGLWGNPPPSTPLPTRVSSSGASPACSCSGNLYNCPDFSTHASAQACYDYCNSTGHGDIHRMDGDNDGSACEDLP